MSFIEKLKEIFPGKHEKYDWRVCRLIINEIDNGYEIYYGCEYDSPIEVTFPLLKKLSELFNTENIDVDDYSRSGCPTCDFGSQYGHTFQLREIKDNENGLKELIDKGDLYNSD